MADTARIMQLMLNRLQGTLTAPDEAELNAWIAASPANRLYVENLVTLDAITEDLTILTELDEEALDKKVWDKIHTADKTPPVEVIHSKRNSFSQALAAASIVILCVFSFIYTDKDALELSVRLKFSPYRDAIFERRSPVLHETVTRPTLAMSKDSIYLLDSMPKGKLTRLGSWLILKTSDHRLVYTYIKHSTKTTALPDSLYNMLSVPPGIDSWTVSLPDGTIVVVSPGSSLSFSIHPLGTKPTRRMAALYGQALFNVTHDPTISFYLETPKAELLVRGTNFMVSDFGQEDTFSLLQYSGKLDLTDGRQHTQVDSAERATVSLTHAGIRIDTGVSLPKQNFPQPETFDFSHRSLKSALKELASWYGVAHLYVDQDLDSVTLGKLNLGHLSKDLSLDDLLEQLQKQTKDMHFATNDDMISVKKQPSSGPDQTR